MDNGHHKIRIRMVKHSQGPSAAPRLEAIWTEATSLSKDDAYLSHIANMIADTYRSWNKHDDAIRYAHYAINHEKSVEGSPLLGNHYLFLVTVMEKRGDDPGAILNVAQEGLVHYQSMYGSEHTEVRYIESMVKKYKRLAQDKE